MLFVYSTRLRLVMWMTRDKRFFLQDNPIEMNEFEEGFIIMFKMCLLYIVLNLSEYTMTLVYFVTVSFFYRKFHDDQGYCYIRRAYMMVIWMFNITVQCYGMWVVFGSKTKDIQNYVCTDKKDEENLTDECERNQKIVYILRTFVSLARGMVEFRAILYILASIVGGFTFLSIFFLQVMRMFHDRRESHRSVRET